MPKLKSLIKSVMRKIDFRATDTELAEMQKKADKYCNGNLSAWIRYAATQLEPPKKDLV